MRRIHILAGAAIAIVVAMAWLGPILTPFLVGAVFAYLGTPVMTWAM
jgi:predicted PurR-regulated permease PerM